MITYNIYFQWLDGTKDTIQAEGLKECKLNIKAIKDNNLQKLLSVEKIVKGEYMPVSWKY